MNKIPRMQNEKRDKIVSRGEDVICANPITSAKMCYALSLLQTNPQNCFDENALRPVINVFDPVIPIGVHNLRRCVIPLEATSYNDGVILTADKPIYCFSQEYQSIAPCYSNRGVLTEETCSAVVIVKDTETNSAAILSQVLGNGDKRNLGDEHEKYAKRILAYIISLGVPQSTAEDLTQNVFIQSCYDYANGQEIKHFEGYLFGLARNIVHIYRRKEALLPTKLFLSDIEDMMTQSTIEPADVLEVNGDVREAIAELPQKYREAFSLRYIHNLPLSAAAQRAGCSKNTFYQRVHIATDILKSKLHSR